jgi:hypothetical protein
MKKLAMIGLAIIGLCLAGIWLKSNPETEVVVTRSIPMKEEMIFKDEHVSESPSNLSKLDKQQRKPAVETGKSAARRVIEGIGPSNSATKVERKSAARKSMEQF